MHIPSAQHVLTAGLALTGLTALKKDKNTIASGKITDFAVESCVDDEGTQRCTAPFLVSDSGCYELKWSTDGTFSHTTAEVRDVKSSEVVFYRDTDGQWEPEKNELVYMDFKPKVPNTGNSTVTYSVTKCEKKDGDDSL